jgi:hypothetical protein
MKYAVLLFLFCLIFLTRFSCTTFASCTPKNYSECERGNPTYCLSHGVPIDHKAGITLHSNCTYSCKDLGPCSSGGSTSSSKSSSASSVTSSANSSTTSSTATGNSFINLVLQLPGIGGLNGGNPSPIHPTRTVTVYLYTATQDPNNLNDIPIIATGAATLVTTTGDQAFGYFVDPNLNVGNLNGQYQIFVKSNQYLRAPIVTANSSTTTNTFQLTSGKTTALPQVTLIAGDIFPPPTDAISSYGDNVLDISDYNMLISCYGDKATSSICPNKNAADLNDDGKIDGIDYNILLRSFFQLQNGNH